MRVLGVVALLGLLAGCASTVADSQLDAEAKLFRAPADKACIYIAPTQGLTDVVIRFDGRKVATLTDQYYLRLEVAPGRHVLAAIPSTVLPTMFRDTTHDVTLEAAMGQCYYFRTLWTDDPSGLRERRVGLQQLSENAGQRAVNVLWLMLPAK
jgi:hypothetical protein